MRKRAYKSKLREQSKLETQQRIAEAAMILHGEGILDTEKIAEEAGVSLATVRKYYPTREDLFKGCTEHFLKSHTMPPIEKLAEIKDPGERLIEAVRQIYSLHEMSFGQSWLSFKLQEESEVMNATRQQADAFINSAVDMLLHGLEPASAPSPKNGYIRGLFSPLTYRALRLFGHLNFEEACVQTILVVSSLLNVPLPKSWNTGGDLK
jgi:AcrR family transcriptional regulator